MGSKTNTHQSILYLTSIVMPPLAVHLATNGVKIYILKNIGLTLFGWLPGVLHAMYLIQKQP
ncbi:hypothetical protein VTK56DRAFT_1147 [Thermocarpiscus australiensis]